MARQPEGPSGPARRRAGAIVVAVALLATFAPASPAGASTRSLGRVLHTWSQRIGVDAHSVALAARNRHPRRMVSSARRFRVDALKARAALRAQRPSTADGRIAKGLAVRAFATYATAGRLWIATGRARLRGDKPAAARSAAAAAAQARSGNRLLVRAGRLLP